MVINQHSINSIQSFRSDYINLLQYFTQGQPTMPHLAADQRVRSEFHRLADNIYPICQYQDKDKHP